MWYSGWVSVKLLMSISAVVVLVFQTGIDELFIQIIGTANGKGEWHNVYFVATDHEGILKENNIRKFT